LARMAACYKMKGEKAQADALADEVARFNPKPATFWFELGERLEDRRRFDEAEKCFNESLKQRPGQPGPSNSLGMLKMRLGQEKEAAELLKKGFEADPFNVRVSNTLRVLRHLEKYETLRRPHFELRYDPKLDKVLAELMADELEEIYKELSA